MPFGILEVYLESAFGIKDTTLKLFGKGSPYCILTCGSQMVQTEPVQEGGSSPFWGKSFNFKIDRSTKELNIKILNKNYRRDDDVLGETTLSVQTLFRGGHSLQVTSYAVRRPSGRVHGEVILGLNFFAKVRPKDYQERPQYVPNVQMQPRPLQPPPSIGRVAQYPPQEKEGFNSDSSRSLDSYGGHPASINRKKVVSFRSVDDNASFEGSARHYSDQGGYGGQRSRFPEEKDVDPYGPDQEPYDAEYQNVPPRGGPHTGQQPTPPPPGEMDGPGRRQPFPQRQGPQQTVGTARPPQQHAPPGQQQRYEAPAQVPQQPTRQRSREQNSPTEGHDVPMWPRGPLFEQQYKNEESSFGTQGRRSNPPGQQPRRASFSSLPGSAPHSPSPAYDERAVDQPQEGVRQTSDVRFEVPPSRAGSELRSRTPSLGSGMDFTHPSVHGLESSQLLNTASRQGASATPTRPENFDQRSVQVQDDPQPSDAMGSPATPQAFGPGSFNQPPGLRPRPPQHLNVGSQRPPALQRQDLNQLPELGRGGPQFMNTGNQGGPYMDQPQPWQETGRGPQPYAGNLGTQVRPPGKKLIQLPAQGRGGLRPLPKPGSQGPLPVSPVGPPNQPTMRGPGQSRQNRFKHRPMEYQPAQPSGQGGGGPQSDRGPPAARPMAEQLVQPVGQDRGDFQNLPTGRETPNFPAFPVAEDILQQCQGGPRNFPRGTLGTSSPPAGDDNFQPVGQGRGDPQTWTLPQNWSRSQQSSLQGLPEGNLPQNQMQVPPDYLVSDDRPERPPASVVGRNRPQSQNLNRGQRGPVRCPPGHTITQTRRQIPPDHLTYQDPLHPPSDVVDRSFTQPVAQGGLPTLPSQPLGQNVQKPYLNPILMPSQGAYQDSDNKRPLGQMVGRDAMRHASLQVRRGVPPPLNPRNPPAPTSDSPPAESGQSNKKSSLQRDLDSDTDSQCSKESRRSMKSHSSGVSNTSNGSTRRIAPLPLNSKFPPGIDHSENPPITSQRNPSLPRSASDTDSQGSKNSKESNRSKVSLSTKQVSVTAVSQSSLESGRSVVFKTSYAQDTTSLSPVTSRQVQPRVAVEAEEQGSISENEIPDSAQKCDNNDYAKNSDGGRSGQEDEEDGTRSFSVGVTMQGEAQGSEEEEDGSEKAASDQDIDEDKELENEDYQKGQFERHTGGVSGHEYYDTQVVVNCDDSNGQLEEDDFGETGGPEVATNLVESSEQSCTVALSTYSGAETATIYKQTCSEDVAVESKYTVDYEGDPVGGDQLSEVCADPNSYDVEEENQVTYAEYDEVYNVEYTDAQYGTDGYDYGQQGDERGWVEGIDNGQFYEADEEPEEEQYEGEDAEQEADDGVGYGWEQEDEEEVEEEVAEEEIDDNNFINPDSSLQAGNGALISSQQRSTISGAATSRGRPQRNSHGQRRTSQPPQLGQGPDPNSRYLNSGHSVVVTPDPSAVQFHQDYSDLSPPRYPQIGPGSYENFLLQHQHLKSQIPSNADMPKAYNPTPRVQLTKMKDRVKEFYGSACKKVSPYMGPILAIAATEVAKSVIGVDLGFIDGADIYNQGGDLASYMISTQDDGIGCQGYYPDQDAETILDTTAINVMTSALNAYAHPANQGPRPPGNMMRGAPMQRPMRGMPPGMRGRGPMGRGPPRLPPLQVQGGYRPMPGAPPRRPPNQQMGS